VQRLPYLLAALDQRSAFFGGHGLERIQFDALVERRAGNLRQIVAQGFSA
jgi:hypothetical protein